MCIPLQSQAPRCASYRGVKLSGVFPTAESSSGVCITPWSQTAHRGVKLHTGESNLWESLVALKGTIRRIPFKGKLFYHLRKDMKKFFFNC